VSHYGAHHITLFPRMTNSHHRLVVLAKSVARGAVENVIAKLMPGVAARLACRVLVVPDIAAHLPPVAVAQLRQVLDETVETGHAQESYAQEGEDLVIARLLGERGPGFYVDVGAHHPARHSNTFLLYRRGWRGINIDATPGSMAVFGRMRPRDVNVEALVASNSLPRVFHQFNEPALNTASAELAVFRPNESSDFKVTSTVTMTPRTLASILDQYMPAGQTIDMMSVDVEGLDLDVLVSNDWARFRPALLLVEILATALHDIDQHEIVRFLDGHGYRPVAKLYNTVIFR
jgi:hypothetical protein